MLDVVYGLCSPMEAARDAALRALLELYVQCTADGCGTDAQVARLVIPPMLRALESLDSAVRVAAAQALGILAADARSALPELSRALSDRDITVRIAALEAIGEFAGGAAPFAPEVAACLARATAAEERRVAAETLHNLVSMADG